MDPLWDNLKNYSVMQLDLDSFLRWWRLGCYWHSGEWMNIYYHNYYYIIFKNLKNLKWGFAVLLWLYAFSYIIKEILNYNNEIRNIFPKNAVSIPGCHNNAIQDYTTATPKEIQYLGRCRDLPKSSIVWDSKKN